VDLANGFYQVWLSVGVIPKLVVALPMYDNEEPMVALPLTLPMGWMDSVRYFCSATKTVANIANSKLMNVHMPLHPLKKLANTKPPDEALLLPPPPVMPPVLRPHQMPLSHHDTKQRKTF
jgi:hypothetical protein